MTSAPAPEAARPGAPAPGDGGARFTLVATAKDEGPYFLEWVAWHRLIGFTDILVFQNDSTDGTDAILKCLDRIGAVRYLYNRAKRGAHQVRAYNRAARQPEMCGAGWAMALDMDEFLHVKAGAGTLPDLIAALPGCDQVLVNWRLFGCSGQDTITDDLVTSRFTRCEDPDRILSDFVGYKSLFRPALFQRAGVHNPSGPRIAPDAVRLVNGSGLPPDGFTRRKWRTLDPGRRALAQVNHYAVRDAASFVLKNRRGSAHQSDRDLGQSYWNRRNYNLAEDSGLARMAPAIRAEMARLDALSDGQLGALRAEAVACHADWFRAGPGWSSAARRGCTISAART